MNTSTNAKARYENLKSDRQPFVDRGVRAAHLTMPTLFIDKENNEVTSEKDFPTPRQSMGARGVRNLSSKLLVSLVPTNAPFMRMRPEEALKQKLNTDPDLKAEVEKALVGIEAAVMRDVDDKGDRVAMGEAFKHLLVTGNVLLFDDKKDGLRWFGLNKYVARRDAGGRLLEIVIAEGFDPESLPEDVQALIAQSKNEDEPRSTKATTVTVYTWIKRDGDAFVAHQEVEDQVIPDTTSRWPEDRLPYFPLRMVRIEGEDYGRGYVEEFFGDLESLEVLTGAIVDGAAAASKVLFLVKPNSTTKARVLAKAPNGAIREGNSDDVSVLQMNKVNDFRVASEIAQRIQDRLAHAFLLNTSVQRNAERVTAEEIRFVAEELEQGLGGIFSILTQEFQLPFAKGRLARLQASNKLPQLPKGVVRPVIITGLEALGRGMDRQRLLQYLTTVAQTFGPEAIAQEMNRSVLMERLAIADGIELEGLFKTPDQKAAEAQQSQQQQMISDLGPDALKQFGPQIAQQVGAATGVPPQQEE